MRNIKIEIRETYAFREIWPILNELISGDIWGHAQTEMLIPIGFVIDDEVKRNVKYVCRNRG